MKPLFLYAIFLKKIHPRSYCNINYPDPRILGDKDRLVQLMMAFSFNIKMEVPAYTQLLENN
jgi:hypothetical protein